MKDLGSAAGVERDADDLAELTSLLLIAKRNNDPMLDSHSFFVACRTF